MYEIDIAGVEFEEIFSDIKNRYLSTTNFPKFIIGTGLSITFNIPGMHGLANELDANFSKHRNSKYKDTWEKCEPTVRRNGLEAALLTIPTQDNDFVERIREITGKFILEADYKVRENILKNKSAFEELLGYLIRSVSVNKKIIDVMTPNYDLIIETVADKLNLITTLGFNGNLFQTFDQEILKNPSKYYNNNNTILRVFKPHGSINWINRDGYTYQTNDHTYLEMNSNCIEVVAPGSMKFQYGMTHDLLRQHREIFNSVYTDSMSNHSIFIYGYGFNDQQFDTVFENTKKDVIVLSMEIKKDIIDRALTNTNWTIFYKQIKEDKEVDDDYSFMVYKGKQYKLNSQLWNLDDFVKVFIG
ncbi:TPA: SIR2 family protein [Streptococcus suis]|nr:SIR2 family protein [Streptococcus suis]